MVRMKTPLWLHTVVLRGAVLVVAVLVACGESPLLTRPLAPGNKKDRYGFWVHQYPECVRFDRNCREVYRLLLDGGLQITEINPTTGELWALEKGNLYIMDGDGQNKRFAGAYPYHGGYEFDTNAEVVWIFDRDGFIKKLDYKGKLMTTKVAPEDLRMLGAYEKTGEVWAIDHYSTRSPTHLYKFDANGELIFSKEPKDIGFSSRETEFYDLHVDQTDGSIWVHVIGNYGNYNLFKFDAEAKTAPAPALRGRILYVDDKRGDFLVKAADSFFAYMIMYDKSGSLLWFVFNKYEMADSAFLSPADGSAFFLEKVTRKAPWTLSKVTRYGERVVEGVQVPKASWLKARREPYPYKG